MPNALVKINTADGSHVIWRNAPDEFGVYIGEPVFVSAPGGVDEDDGVVLAAGVGFPEERGFLLVLNASTMVEIARARSLAEAFSFAFHTMWVPDDTVHRR